MDTLLLLNYNYYRYCGTVVCSRHCTRWLVYVTRLCGACQPGNDLLPQQFAADAVHDAGISQCYI